MNKVNFRQPKYILPAIIYIPILVTGYFLIDMFSTEVKSVDKNLQQTEYLNPELPEARIDGDLGNKRDNMTNAFGDVTDYTAVENAERDSVKGKEEYESRYKASEAAKIRRNNEELENLRQMQNRLRASQNQRSMGSDDYVPPISDDERRNARRLRSRDDYEESDRLLAQARSRARRNNYAGYDDEDNPDDADADRKSGAQSGQTVANTESEETPESVVKKVKSESEYFSTVSQNAPESSLISAIIDENIKAVEGSRVRLRLLDDVEISGKIVPKGTYLYAQMSGFSKQRVKGKVSSIFVGDEISSISLSIYDTDGLEGLYVPSSSFRETVKDVGSSAMQQSMSLDGSSSTNSVSQWAQQAAQQAYQRTTQAISKAIRKNSVRLKYGTVVYLVNSKDIKKK